MNVEQARFNMVEQQIRPAGVLDERVLNLLLVLRREAFVPPAHRDLAFADMELPLRDAEVALKKGQVMLAPKVEARILQDVDVQKTDKVLEVGTGSGYMAALLASRASHVISLEIDAELVALAKDNLQRAGIGNVEVRQADGAVPPLDGPFDVIVLSGSMAEVPQAYLDALKPGGRLMAIVGVAPVMRGTLVRRTASGFETTQPWDTNAPRLQHFPEAAVFEF
ncbi:protein-L-isoaspartate O-methyltransferase [Comamonas serinivorans]|uniref:Protein-L-isoaspartate O-methyltransferase n=1 Tax=Comamonas serinivorans TaxID=1082851 RepID=A0A1Y0EPJ8_9BURK|nr:protein-L-isoaspartate O-methyltransferase [Comamonas serinivorans]ARU05408.1 protein-L-isoaspartate O-methyltransferase [Comamonas serinivorans]